MALLYNGTKHEKTVTYKVVEIFLVNGSNIKLTVPEAMVDYYSKAPHNGIDVAVSDTLNRLVVPARSVLYVTVKPEQV